MCRRFRQSTGLLASASSRKLSRVAGLPDVRLAAGYDAGAVPALGRGGDLRQWNDAARLRCKAADTPPTTDAECPSLAGSVVRISLLGEWLPGSANIEKWAAHAIQILQQGRVEQLLRDPVDVWWLVRCVRVLDQERLGGGSAVRGLHVELTDKIVAALEPGSLPFPELIACLMSVGNESRVPDVEAWLKHAAKAPTQPDRGTGVSSAATIDTEEAEFNEVLDRLFGERPEPSLDGSPAKLQRGDGGTDVVANTPESIGVVAHRLRHITGVRGGGKVLPLETSAPRAKIVKVAESSDRSAAVLDSCSAAVQRALPSLRAGDLQAVALGVDCIASLHLGYASMTVRNPVASIKPSLAALMQSTVFKMSPLATRRRLCDFAVAVIRYARDEGGDDALLEELMQAIESDPMMLDSQGDEFPAVKTAGVGIKALRYRALIPAVGDSSVVALQQAITAHPRMLRLPQHGSSPHDPIVCCLVLGLGKSLTLLPAQSIALFAVSLEHVAREVFRSSNKLIPRGFAERAHAVNTTISAVWRLVECRSDVDGVGELALGLLKRIAFASGPLSLKALAKPLDVRRKCALVAVVGKLVLTSVGRSSGGLLSGETELLLDALLEAIPLLKFRSSDLKRLSSSDIATCVKGAVMGFHAVVVLDGGKLRPDADRLLTRFIASASPREVTTAMRSLMASSEHIRGWEVVCDAVVASIRSSQGL